MSIFPKCSVRGGNISIHWNFNSAALCDAHVFPFVRIGVKDPAGKVTMLLEKHILALPQPGEQDDNPDIPKLKYLNKNVPLLVIAEYLSGKFKKEKLVEILQNIQSGRHYYFTFPIGNDAPLGKYTLISELHIDGEIRYSKTAMEDFFLIELLDLKEIIYQENRKTAIVTNHSPEPVAVKLISLERKESQLKSRIKLLNLPAEAETAIPLQSDIHYLLYNEEREIISLNDASGSFILRNQGVLPLSKDQTVYLIKKENDDAFELTGRSKALWACNKITCASILVFLFFLIVTKSSSSYGYSQILSLDKEQKNRLYFKQLIS